MASESTRLDMQQAEPMTEREVDEAATHAAANPAQADRQRVPQCTQSELNGWFLSLPEGRQKVLVEDKWLLASAAFEAGKAAAPEAPAQANAVDERAAFEAWALREYATVRREHGELRWDSPSVGAAVEHALSWWQARAALAQKGGK